MIRQWILLGTTVAFAAIGCSNSSDSPKAIVKGKIVDGAKPYTAAAPTGKAGQATAPPAGADAPNASLEVQFSPAEGGDLFIAQVNAETGAFKITGHDGKGIKPGKYKVFLDRPNAMPGMTGTPDLFGGKFGREKSKIERDVTIDGPEIVIDVSKPAG